MKWKNTIALLLVALFGFGAGFIACWFRIGVRANKTIREVPYMVFMLQHGQDLLAAQEVYFREPPKVALGAMLSYVEKMNGILEAGADKAYPEQADMMYHYLYLAHGRIAKLYRTLDQPDKAQAHTELALSHVADKKWVDEERMISDVDRDDEWQIENREKEANKMPRHIP